MRPLGTSSRRALSSERGIESAPRRCPARNSSRGRTSRTVTSPRCARRRSSSEAIASIPSRAPKYSRVTCSISASRDSASIRTATNTLDTCSSARRYSTYNPFFSLSTSRAARSTRRCCDAFATDKPASSASASTVRGPWQRRSSNSMRLGAENPLAMRASCS